MEYNYHLALLVLLLITISSPPQVSSSRDHPTKNTEFIRTSCVATSYPKLCYTSLSVHAAKIQSSPQLIATTALGVSLSSAKATSSALRQLSLARKNLGPGESGAMRDCLEELADTVDELRKSAAEMEKMVNGLTTTPESFGMAMSDVQTWVSAALTDETTCSDGFDERPYSNNDGDLKSVVKRKIVYVAHLTSNALALINKYAMIHG